MQKVIRFLYFDDAWNFLLLTDIYKFLEHWIAQIKQLFFIRLSPEERGLVMSVIGISLS